MVGIGSTKGSASQEGWKRTNRGERAIACRFVIPDTVSGGRFDVVLGLAVSVGRGCCTEEWVDGFLGRLGGTRIGGRWRQRRCG